MKQETKCLHSGNVHKNGEPRQMPIYQSTTFKYDSSDAMGRLFDLEDSGYFYTRLQNPSNDMTAAKIADLEGGVAAMLTSSGQAANFFALFNICETGSHIVASSAIYGGTYNLLGVTMKKMGIDVTFVDQDLPEEELAKAFRPNTRAMFGETITNPTVSVLDIEKFARLAHSHGVPLIVDNTFATPVNCQPIKWGADIVTHSTTKYMDGHAVSVGGAIVDSGNFDWLKYADKYPGLTTPDDSYHGIVYAEAEGQDHRRYAGQRGLRAAGGRGQHAYGEHQAQPRAGQQVLGPVRGPAAAAAGEVGELRQLPCQREGGLERGLQLHAVELRRRILVFFDGVPVVVRKQVPEPQGQAGGQAGDFPVLRGGEIGGEELLLGIGI